MEKVTINHKLRKKDGKGWRRFTQISNYDELEKFGLDFSRCTKPDVTPLKAHLSKTFFLY